MVELLMGKEIKISAEVLQSQNIRFIPTTLENGQVLWEGYRRNPFDPENPWVKVKQWDTAECLRQIQSGRYKLHRIVKANIDGRQVQLKLDLEGHE